MITLTSLRHPTLMKALKDLIIQAVKLSAKEPSGLGIVAYDNRRGKHSMTIVYVKGRGYKVFEASTNREITDTVNRAFYIYHDKQEFS